VSVMIKAVALADAVAEAGHEAGDILVVDIDGDIVEKWLLVPESEVITVQQRLDWHYMIFENHHEFEQDPDDILGGCKVCWNGLDETADRES